MTETVLVTGGAGYIGSQLIPLLLDTYQVRVMDTLDAPDTSLLPYFAHPRFSFVNGDIRDSDTVEDAVDGVDHIIHLAAVSGTAACDNNPEKARTTNIDGTALVDDLRGQGTSMLFVSTGSVYGSTDSTCTEDTEPAPRSLYARTKYKAEQEIAGSEKTVIYRPATAFGVSPRLRTDLLVNTFVRHAVDGETLDLYEPDNMRTFINVTDLARSLVHGIEHIDQMAGEVYNIGHESLNMTKQQVCRTIDQHIPLQTRTVPGNDPDHRDYPVDYQKIQEIGFTTEKTIGDGVQNLVNAYRYMDRLHQ